MQCKNHPNVAASDQCTGCAEPLCPDCLVPIHGQLHCARCKMKIVQGPPPPPASQAGEIAEQAKNALLLAIASLFCAIVFAPMALHKAREAKRRMDKNSRLDGRGLATAAQVIAIGGLILWGVGFLVGMLARSRA